jgi:hypothetical protein
MPTVVCEKTPGFVKLHEVGEDPAPKPEKNLRLPDEEEDNGGRAGVEMAWSTPLRVLV